MGQLFGKGHGPGSKKPAAPQITSETAASMAAIAHTPEAKAKREAKIATAEELKGVLSDIALDDAALPMARIQAADKLLDRIEGKPTQTLNANIRRNIAELSDEELAAIAAGGAGDIETEDGST
jgi:isocitrate/isopropylmalate dehydrogenase